MRTKFAAGMLAFFLGGLGIHKFYLGKIGWGILYLFFCWTFVPAFLGLCETIYYFSMKDDVFNRHYNKGGV